MTDLRLEHGQPFVLVHSADLHLGSAMAVAKRLDRADDLAGATYDALDNLITLVETEDAQVMTLAGDLFDHADQKNPVPRRRLVDALQRVPECAVAVVRGNHDHHMSGAPDPRYPDHVFEFRGEKKTWDLGWLRLHGVSFDKQHVRESLLPRYPAPSPDHLDFGLLHANVGGQPGHDDYAPCTVNELAAHGYDAWLLGHIHKRAVLSEDPLVLYPGNLQGRHVNEAGPRTAEVIEVDEAGGLRHRPEPVHSLLWHRQEVDVSDCETLDDVMDAAARSIETIRSSLSGQRGAIVRFSLVGASGAHAAMVRLVDEGEHPFEQLLQDDLNDRFAHEDPFVLTEKVRRSTRLPLDLEAARESKDILGVLVRLSEEPATREAALQVLRQGPLDEQDAQALLESLWESTRQGAATRVVAGRDTR